MEDVELQAKVLKVLEQTRLTVMALVPTPPMPTPEDEHIYPVRMAVSFVASMGEYDTVKHVLNLAGLWMSNHSWAKIQGDRKRQTHSVIVREALDADEYSRRKKDYYTKEKTHGSPQPGQAGHHLS